MIGISFYSILNLFTFDWCPIHFFFSLEILSNGITQGFIRGSTNVEAFQI